VWDVGTWEPEGDAEEMMRKGDLKFRLEGQKLKGSFALIHMKARRPGSKGTEWLLIKHRDAYVQEGYDIDKYDYSVLTERSLKQIAGDAGSAEWKSSRAASTRGGSSKNDWLADSIAKADAKKAKGMSAKSAKKTTARPGGAPAAPGLKKPAKSAVKEASTSSAGSASLKKNSAPKKRIAEP